MQPGSPWPASRGRAGAGARRGSPAPARWAGGLRGLLLGCGLSEVRDAGPGRAAAALVRERSPRPGPRVRTRAAARIPASRSGYALGGLSGGRFTLIELILALVLLSVLSAVMASFFGALLTRSPEPALQLPATAALLTVLEQINADYETTYRTNLAGLKARIEASPSPYGSYTVVECRYVRFDEQNQETAEGATENDILKVTLRASHGGRITALFPRAGRP